MEEIDYVHYYKRVVETLKMLALPYRDQEALLPDFVYVPTDVISSFDHVFLLLPPLIEQGHFSNPAIAQILRVNNWLRWCAGNVAVEEFENSHSDWNKVRDLAAEAVIILNEPIEKPDLNYI